MGRGDSMGTVHCLHAWEHRVQDPGLQMMMWYSGLAFKTSYKNLDLNSILDS